MFVLTKHHLWQSVNMCVCVCMCVWVCMWVCSLPINFVLFCVYMFLADQEWRSHFRHCQQHRKVPWLPSSGDDLPSLIAWHSWTLHWTAWHKQHLQKYFTMLQPGIPQFWAELRISWCGWVFTHTSLCQALQSLRTRLWAPQEAFYSSLAWQVSKMCVFLCLIWVFYDTIICHVHYVCCVFLPDNGPYSHTSFRGTLATKQTRVS